MINKIMMRRRKTSALSKGVWSQGRHEQRVFTFKIKSIHPPKAPFRVRIPNTSYLQSAQSLSLQSRSLLIPLALLVPSFLQPFSHNQYVPSVSSLPCQPKQLKNQSLQQLSPEYAPSVPVRSRLSQSQAASVPLSPFSSCCSSRSYYQQLQLYEAV